MDRMTAGARSRLAVITKRYISGRVFGLLALCALLALIALGILASPEAAEAQQATGGVNVSNLTTASSDGTYVPNPWVANKFRTGGTSAHRFTLDSVVIDFHSNVGSAVVQIRANNNGVPGNQIGSNLTRVGTHNSGNITFNASGITLNGATDYFMTVHKPGSLSVEIRRQADNRESGANGWSIANSFHLAPSLTAWIDEGTNSLRFRVNASAEAPRPINVHRPTANHQSITVTWDPYVPEADREPFTKYRVSIRPVGGTTVTADLTDIASASYSRSGLVNHQQYDVWVEACNVSACSGARSGQTWQVMPGWGASNIHLTPSQLSLTIPTDDGATQFWARNGFTLGGSSADTFTLDSVTINVQSRADLLDVEIHDRSHTIGQIGSDLTRVGSATSGNITYNTSGITLRGGSTYYLVVEIPQTTAHLRLDDDDGEVATQGWGIADAIQVSRSSKWGPWADSFYSDDSFYSGYSLLFSVVATPTAAPSPVKSYQATSDDGTITFTWDKYVQEHGRRPFTKYRAHIKDLTANTAATTTDITNVNTTSHTFSGLTNGRAYEVFLTVCNQDGCSSHGDYVWRLRPGWSVGNLEVTSARSWTDSPRTQHRATSFTTGGVSTDSYALDNVVIDFAAGATTSEVRVHADSGGGPGAAIGAPLTQVGSAATGLITYNASGIILQGGTTYYLVVRLPPREGVHSTASGSDAGTPGWSIGDALHASNVGGVPGSWTIDRGIGPIRFNVNASPAPPTPVRSYQPRAGPLTGRQASNGTIKLTWDKYVQEADREPFTKYRAHIRPLTWPATTTTTVTDVTDINATSHTWTGLTRGQPYEVYVEVCHQYGCTGRPGDDGVWQVIPPWGWSVSNLPVAAAAFANNRNETANAFTTAGVAADSYTVDNVVIEFDSAGNADNANVSIHANNNGVPGAQVGSNLHKVGNATTGNVTFQVRDGNAAVVLNGAATYFLKITKKNTSASIWTEVHIEDGEVGTRGWSIANGLWLRDSSTSSWESSEYSLRFAVHTDAAVAPTPPRTYPPTAGNKWIKWTWDKYVQESNRPLFDRYSMILLTCADFIRQPSCASTEHSTDINTTSHTWTGLVNGRRYAVGLPPEGQDTWYPIASVDISNTSAGATLRGYWFVVPFSGVGKPQNLTADPGDSQVTLNWTAIPGATGWDYIQCEQPGCWGTGADGDWTDIAGSGATTASHIVTGLTPGTTYYFRVRAENNDGPGLESNEVAATPGAGTAPSFTSSATFNAAENQTAVGTVTAVDDDALDAANPPTFTLEGGADADKFSITDAGVLTFKTAPNFESPTDVASTNPTNAAMNNQYIVTVRAASGTGARRRTADQTITVTVTDANDPPTGRPTITGTEKVGETLTAATTDIADEDGLDSPGWTYQWKHATGGVSNLTQTRAGNTTEEPQTLFANSFTTGGASGDRFTLEHVVIDFKKNADRVDTVRIYTGTSADPINTLVGRALTRAAGSGTSGQVTFNASGITLNGNTTYWLVADGVIQTTTSTSQTGSDGWSIGDNARLRNRTYPNWPQIEGGGALKFSVTARVPVSISGATGATYMLKAADLGRKLLVTVGFTDDNDNAHSLDSADTATVTAAADTAPRFTSFDIFSAAENQTAVGTVVAVDDDVLDTAAPTYALADGADQAKFAITSAGVLTFTAAPNFESPTDVASTTPANDASNNEYVVVVRATSGTGARQKTADQTIIVVVTDVNDAPTGLPTISGTARAGETLTAVTTGIADEDGLTTPGWTYRWKRIEGVSNLSQTSNTNTSGGASYRYATSFTTGGASGDLFTLDNVVIDFHSGADLATVQVGVVTPGTQTGANLTRAAGSGTSGQVTFNASGITLSGDATYWLVVQTPANSSLNTTAGSLETGSTGWSVGDNSYVNYPALGNSWQSRTAALKFSVTTATAISGAENSTYDLKGADEGKKVRVTVGFTDDNVNAHSLDSADSGAIARADPPTLTITGPTTETKDPFTVTLTFNRVVTGFTASDVSVTRGSKGAFSETTTAKVWTLVVTPDAGEDDNDVSVSVAQDAATNNGVGNAAASADFDVDTRPPALSTAAVDGNQLTLTYDETLGANTPATSAYTVEQRAGSSGPWSAVTVDTVTVSGSKVTLALTSAVDVGNNVRVSYVKPTTNKLTDAIGNEAAALANQTVTNSSARPTLTITGPTTETKDPFTVTLTFNKAVTGFTASDVSVTRGSKGAFSETTAGTVWTLVVTPAAGEDDNDVTVSVAQDAATNNGVGNAAASKDFDVDTRPPALSTAAVDGNQLTLTYDETLGANTPVTSAYTVEQRAGSSGPWSAVTVSTVTVSGSKVTLALASAVDVGNNVRVSYAKPTTNKLTDAIGNEAAALSNQTVTNNSARPTLTISGPTTETKDPFTVTLTFNKAVTGFTASDVSVTRGSKGAFTETTAGKVWTLVVTPDAGEDDNDVEVSVAQDAATNNGVGNAAASADFDVDTRPPALSTAAVDGNVLTLTYDETLGSNTPVTSAYTVEQRAGSSGPWSAVTVDTVTVSGSKVTLALTSAVDVGNNVRVSYVKPTTNKLTDAIGNEAAALANQTVTNSSARPTLTITGPTTETKDPFTVTLTFNKAVTGFTASDVSVTRGSKGAFSETTAGTVWTLVVTPAAGEDDNDVTVSVAQDAATNNGVGNAAASKDFDVDTRPPALSTAAVDGNVLTLTYDETLGANTPVTSAYTVEQRAGSSGPWSAVTVDSVTVNATAKTVTLALTSAVGVGNNVRVSYVKPGSNQLTDAIGNEAAALSNQTVTNNSARPTLTITGPTTETKDPFTVTLTFNKAVTGFVAADVSVTRGSKGAFTETTAAKVWTLVITPAAGEDDNDVTVSVAQDAATNNGVGNAAASKDFDVDTRPPALSTAAVDGNALVLTYDETLGSNSPATSAYTVETQPSGGSFTGVTVDTVTVSGSKVTLALTSAVGVGDNVRVSYAKPASNKLTDAIGNEAGGARQPGRHQQQRPPHPHHHGADHRDQGPLHRHPHLQQGGQRLHSQRRVGHPRQQGRLQRDHRRQGLDTGNHPGRRRGRQRRGSVGGAGRRHVQRRRQRRRLSRLRRRHQAAGPEHGRSGRQRTDADLRRDPGQQHAGHFGLHRRAARRQQRPLERGHGGLGHGVGQQGDTGPGQRGGRRQQRARQLRQAHHQQTDRRHRQRGRRTVERGGHQRQRTPDADHQRAGRGDQGPLHRHPHLQQGGHRLHRQRRECDPGQQGRLHRNHRRHGLDTGGDAGRRRGRQRRGSVGGAGRSHEQRRRQRRGQQGFRRRHQAPGPEHGRGGRQRPDAHLRRDPGRGHASHVGLHGRAARRQQRPLERGHRGHGDGVGQQGDTGPDQRGGRGQQRARQLRQAHHQPAHRRHRQRGGGARQPGRHQQQRPPHPHHHGADHRDQGPLHRHPHLQQGGHRLHSQRRVGHPGQQGRLQRDHRRQGLDTGNHPRRRRGRQRRGSVGGAGRSHEQRRRQRRRLSRLRRRHQAASPEHGRSRRQLPDAHLRRDPRRQHASHFGLHGRAARRQQRPLERGHRGLGHRLDQRQNGHPGPGQRRRRRRQRARQLRQAHHQPAHRRHRQRGRRTEQPDGH